MDLENTKTAVYEGWLTKSPPLETKKNLLKAVPVPVSVQPKWRRRWFVLREGGLPGQFHLQYYTDSHQRKLKGTIDLDQLEQVDTGLTFDCGKVKYQYMFDIKTPKRVYYLAADSEQEMTRWVDYVCQVCGLRPIQTDDAGEEEEGEGGLRRLAQESAAAAAAGAVAAQPSSSRVEGGSISGPYMHLSECFTGGKPPVESHIRSPLTSTTSCSSTAGGRPPSPTYQNSLPLSHSLLPPQYPPPALPPGISEDDSSSLNCGDDTVFLPNSPGPSRPSNEGSIVTSYGPGGTLTAQFSRDGCIGAPGRPPKPNSLRPNPQGNYPPQGGNENYANHEEMRLLVSSSQQQADTLRMENNNNNNNNITKLQQPLHAPHIDRRLKPNTRAQSFDESATMPASKANGHFGPPVERNLKPRGGASVTAGGTLTNHVGAAAAAGTVATLTGGTRGQPTNGMVHVPGFGSGNASSSFDLGHPGMVVPNGTFGRKYSGGGGGGGGNSGNIWRHRRRSGSDDDSDSDRGGGMGGRRHSVEEEEQIYFFMPSLQQSQGGQWNPLMIPAQEMLDCKIQYLDLDLPPPSTSSPPPSASSSHSKWKSESEKTTCPDSDSGTVYKTVDFMKTEAFNKTRQKVEENRYNMKQQDLGMQQQQHGDR